MFQEPEGGRNHGCGPNCRNGTVGSSRGERRRKRERKQRKERRKRKREAYERQQPGGSRGGEKGRPPVGTKSAGSKRPAYGFRGQREQAKVERAQLWEDKEKVKLICFIVQNDQRE